MGSVNKRLRLVILGSAAMGAILWQPGAYAAMDGTQEYHLESQDLGSALRSIGRTSGREVMFATNIVQGKKAPQIDGRFTPEDAITRLLQGSGLTAEPREGGFLILGRLSAPPAQVADAANRDSDIVVTGSRIRGAPIASSTVSQTQEDMKNQGQASLAEAFRAIPQNFGGGQNPGVGLNVPEGRGLNAGSGSTINLRGLGPDATLTLLNGHRLAYNVANQAIDISSIPFGAVDRIEIVADGASALYGSDAVAGVANIILKRDYDGLSTTARFGASTDGGNAQQQYGAVAGKRWNDGGIMLAYEYEHDTPILSRQRSYASDAAPGLYLYPFLQHHNAMVSGHQELTSNLTFEMDGIFNSRKSNTQYALGRDGNVEANGSKSFFRSKSFVVAPSLKLDLPANWHAAVSGMVGEDRSRYEYDVYSGGIPIVRQIGCYCNRASSAEINADGSLFALPGGDAKVAIGGGYRGNDFHGFRTSGGVQDVKVSQDTYYAFGELSLPIIGPAQQIPFVEKIDISAAMRYERYPGVDDVLTPKLGIVYAPNRDIDFKATWGKSFRAPTLFEQYNLQYASLFSAQLLGGKGYPATATAILLSGGNPNLKPEKATTWSATVDLHPSWLDGARLEISYFNVKYRDRIVTPIAFATQALSNPIYRDLVNFAPSDAEKAAVVANAGVFQSAAGPYVPGNVVAIIDNTNLNVARQSIQGVDILGEYMIDLQRLGRIQITGNASYLDSTQRLSSLQPVTDLAGTVFSPPHLRGRAGFSWNMGQVTLTSFGNYIGGVRDVRKTPSVRVASMATFDTTVRIAVQDGARIFRNLDITLSVQNMFNRKPSLIGTTQPYEAPYDSTNYSAFGRFISLGFAKKW